MKATATGKGNEMKSTTKTTKREQTAKAKNEKRLTATAQQIETLTANENNIINILSIELISILKQKQNINDVEFTNKLQQLATVICQARLKKLNTNDKTATAQTAQLKTEIASLMDRSKGCTKYETYIATLNSLYIVQYNGNGDKITVCTDKKRAQQIEKQLAELNRYFNAEDLIQDVLLMLWKYIEKAITDNNGNTATLDSELLLKPYKQKITHLCIYANGDEKPENLWQYQYTNAIKELLKTVSRYIENQKAPTNDYTPLDECESLSYNPYWEEYETVKQYHKVSRFCVDDVVDFNGKLTTQTANSNNETYLQTILESCNFTRNQAYILKHWLDGESLDEIADKLKVSVRYTENEWQKLKTKIAIFYGQTATAPQTKAPQAINCYQVINGEKMFLHSFESLGIASKTLSVAKSHISDVLKSKRKSAGGYIFEYATAK